MDHLQVEVLVIGVDSWMFEYVIMMLAMKGLLEDAYGLLSLGCRNRCGFIGECELRFE